MVDDIDVAAQPRSASAPAVPSLGTDEGVVKELTGTMAENQRGKIAATDKIYSDYDAVQSRMLPRIEALSKNVGVEAEKLKPWDAEAQAAKYRTDPIEAFGSLGSVFGIIASAFTHAPMENALNASASAMQAIKENDRQGYDRAEKAWMNNYKMALDRHKIQHDAYQDAIALLNTNTAAANTKLQITAARFGDKQVLALLEAGMSKEVQDVIASRQKTAIELADAQPRITAANAEISSLFALGYDSTNPTSPASQEAYKKFKQQKAEEAQAQRAYTPEQAAYASFIKENPNATGEQRADYIRKLRDSAKVLTPEQEAVNKFIEQKPDATAEELRDFVTEMRSKSKGGAAGGNVNLTTDRQRAQDVAKARAGWEAEKNEDGSPKYTPEQIATKAADMDRQLKQRASAPSGNRVDDLKSLRDRATMMTDAIDKVEGLLSKHKALTGIGGNVTRPMEVVSNWFGSNETDRAQFRRYISELQEWGTRVLNESKGRPLSAEVAKLNAILPGLSPGDTTANVVRAYREMKPLLATIQGQLDRRISGDWTPQQPGSTSQPGAGGAKNTPWLRDPVVPGKRSALVADDEVA